MEYRSDISIGLKSHAEEGFSFLEKGEVFVCMWFDADADVGAVLHDVIKLLPLLSLVWLRSH